MQKFDFEVPALEESKFGTFFAGASFPDSMEAEGTDGIWDSGRPKTAESDFSGFFVPFFRGFTHKIGSGICIYPFYKVYYPKQERNPYII